MEKFNVCLVHGQVYWGECVYCRDALDKPLSIEPLEIVKKCEECAEEYFNDGMNPYKGNRCGKCRGHERN